MIRLSCCHYGMPASNSCLIMSESDWARSSDASPLIKMYITIVYTDIQACLSCDNVYENNECTSFVKSCQSRNRQSLVWRVMSGRSGGDFHQPTWFEQLQFRPFEFDAQATATKLVQQLVRMMRKSDAIFVLCFQTDWSWSSCRVSTHLRSSLAKRNSDFVLKVPVPKNRDLKRGTCPAVKRLKTFGYHVSILSSFLVALECDLKIGVCINHARLWTHHHQDTIRSWSRLQIPRLLPPVGNGTL